MPNFADLDKKAGRFADRLRAFQQERDQRSKLALSMLASIEHKVRSQGAALEKANARIAELETERDAAVARASEIIDLYESSLTNNDAFFRGIEALAQKLVGPATPPPGTLVERTSVAAQPSKPPPAAQTAPRPSIVQAPSKTPFLREMGPGQLQPRDRAKDNNGGNGPKT
jgi:hypothetical protein